MSTTKIPLSPDAPRIETGAVQFGDDWPGLFIRGDEAIILAANIRNLLAAMPGINNPAAMSTLVQLDELADVIERGVAVGRKKSKN
jgi:hypothetical protein